MFEPNIVPNDTYVYRKNLDLEEYGFDKTLDESVSQSILKQGMITIIASNSKMGKSILIKKNIDDEKLIEVTGQELNNTNIYVLLAEKLNYNMETKNIFKKSIGIKVVKAENSIEEVEYINLKKNILKYIRENNKIIYIDDFHFINGSEVNPKEMVNDKVDKNIKYISIELKSIIENVKVLITTHPNKVNDITKYNPDLNGRIDLINVPIWKNDEIKEIYIKGFNSSAYNIDNKYIDYCVQKSIGSPLIAQELGYTIVDFVSQDKVSYKTIDNCLKYITRTFNHEELFSKIKENSGNQTIYKLLDDQIITVTFLIIEALKIEPQKNIYTKEELLEICRSLIKNKEDLNLEKIQRGLKNISLKINNNNILTFENNKLYIYDISFLYYLKNKL